MIKTINKKESLSGQLSTPSLIYQKTCNALAAVLPFFPSDKPYNITICNEKKFIWFRVAKVGTRTIFHEFKKNNFILDAEHPMSIHYPANLYKDYFKFAFVRNPWDRLVSCWHNKVLDQNYFNFKENTRDQMMNFGNFVEYVSKQNIEKCDPHLRLQSKLIDLNNINFTGRFETFEMDFSQILQRLGADIIDIEKINATTKKHRYQYYYTDTLRNKVADIYQNDIQLFGYDFK